MLAHGFARFRCTNCEFERLVPLSCKGRGFCASCGSRRKLGYRLNARMPRRALALVLIAIQLSSVSVVAPAREVSVVIVGIAGWLLFKEPHPVQRLIGAAIVLFGVGLLAV